MQIKKHDESYIVKLEDGSSWRIWPGDIALTMRWLPTTALQVSAIEDKFCLVPRNDRDDDEAKTIWPQGFKAPRPYIRIVPQPGG